METRTPEGSSPDRWSVWHLLLLVPFVAVLWVPFYNFVEPRVLGIPFFYVYQLAWVVITSILTAIVYVATRAKPAR